MCSFYLNQDAYSTSLDKMKEIRDESRLARLEIKEEKQIKRSSRVPMVITIKNTGKTENKKRYNTLSDRLKKSTDLNKTNVSNQVDYQRLKNCLLYTSPSPRDRQKSRMPSSA